MTDLSVNFGGLQMPSPIFVGAGPNTKTAESCIQALQAGAGAVECFGPQGAENETDWVRMDRIQILPRARDAFQNRFFGLASTGARLKWHTVENSMDRKLSTLSAVAQKADGLGAVVASIGHVGYDGAGLSWAKLASLSQDAGADAVTLHMQTGQSLAGSIILREPDYLRRVISEIKNACSIPVIAKLPIEGCDPVAVARIAVQAGADAIAPTTRFVALNIDLEQEQVPEWNGFHGYGGPFALPITAAWTAMIRQADVQQPVIPGGGVMSWQDIVRLLLVGATMVQICTWPILRGYQVIGRAARGMSAWMEGKGYRSLDEFRGNTLPHLAASRFLWGQVVKRGNHAGLFVDDQVCEGCRACLPVCFWDAIALGDAGVAHINPNKCVGCGCCYHVCPSSAIISPIYT